jgi:hypothetical protein
MQHRASSLSLFYRRDVDAKKSIAFLLSLWYYIDTLRVVD